MEERIKDLENQVSKLTLVIKNLQSQLNLKADKDKLHDLLGDKELSVIIDGDSFVKKTCEQLRKVNLHRQSHLR